MTLFVICQSQPQAELGLLGTTIISRFGALDVEAAAERKWFMYFAGMLWDSEWVLASGEPDGMSPVLRGR